MLAEQPPVDWAVQALRDGAYDLLTKPVQVEELALRVRSASERHAERAAQERERRIQSIIERQRG